ncbi:hypothetical protein Y697_13380 [Mesotoga sp. BH458_6_3_2_1]|nr:hypothetical protein Y697_13380 [Mesotoga sp. BH458_6_3_2_1]
MRVARFEWNKVIRQGYAQLTATCYMIAIRKPNTPLDHTAMPYHNSLFFRCRTFKEELND